MTSRLVMPMPAALSPSMVTMRSPERMPNFSEGPPLMGETTMMVS